MQHIIVALEYTQPQQERHGEQLEIDVSNKKCTENCAIHRKVVIICGVIHSNLA